MVTPDELVYARQRACKALADAGICLTAGEADTIEVADFGLGQLETTGLEIVVYINTERVCAKELVMFPNQTCPEHRHPPVENDPGKEETFRCRAGVVYLYVEGSETVSPATLPPAGRESSYTAKHEIILHPGQQFTIMPNTRHWFKAGADGAIITEFSTHSRDEADIFTDTEIQRVELA